jgi:acyl dehydratase
VDTSSQGIAFSPVTFEAGQRLAPAIFSRALGIEDPLVRSARAAADAGLTGRLVLPAMLGFHLSVSAEDLEDRLGFTWGRTLNLGIDVDWSGRPVTDGDVITARTSVLSAWERPAREHGVRQFLRLRTDFRLADIPVCRCEVLFTELRDGAVRGDAPESEGDTRGPEFPYAESAPVDDADETDGWQEHIVAPLSRIDLARVSVSTDNPDPLHVDDAVARSAGFDGVLGHGAIVVALLHEPVRRRYGHRLPTRLSTRQTASFGIDDALTVRCESMERSGGLVDARTVVTDQRGREIGSASIRGGALAG